MSQGEEGKPALRSRLMARGESVLLPVGIALAGIIAMATGASAWWSLHTQNQLLQQNRIQQVTAAGTVLSRSIESMIAVNDLSSARRLVCEAARVHNFQECSLALASGQIIADAQASRITTDLPELWPGSENDDASDAPIETYTPDAMTVRFPLWIAGRGAATLQVSVDLPLNEDSQWQTQAGVGAIGVAGLASLLLVYRQMRTRVQAMSLIGEALVALEHGDASDSSLALSEAFGPHARAFNKVLRERQDMRGQLLLRQAEESLGNGQRRGGDLVSVCDALRQGLVYVDGNMQVRYANGAAAVFLKAKRDEIVGAEISKLISHPGVLEAIQSAIHGPTRRRENVEVERAGDECAGLLRFSVRPMRRDEKPTCLIVIEDVTQQRVAEEARNAFVAHATHELRMPLTNIRLYLETALEDGERDPKLRGECLNVINQESKRLERLVGDMLSMTEIESGSLKVEKDDVRLDALFATLEGDYQAQARDKQITLKFNLPPKLPVIQGDREKIVLALHNLIGNACKYTPHGGEVTVNVEAEHSRLIVEVKDTGIGISAEDAEKVFEKFYRAKDSRVNEIVGSGLGLALAREVVRLHGGDITLESELNKGSVFTLTLPIAAEAV